MEGVRFPDQPPIPGYEPIRPLGKNGGVLYVARHSASGVLVALKVWPLELENHARDVHGPLAYLHHPNIIRLFEMGQFEGKFFCALEYVEQTLADTLREGPLPGYEIARIACRLGSALEHAREHGMIPDLSAKSLRDLMGELKLLK